MARDAVVLGDELEAIEYATDDFARRGARLEGAHPAGHFAHDEVGEGAADVDADDEGIARRGHSGAFFVLSPLT